MPPYKASTPSSKTHKSHHSSAPMINPKRPGTNYTLKQTNDSDLRKYISYQRDIKYLYKNQNTDIPTSPINKLPVMQINSHIPVMNIAPRKAVRAKTAEEVEE